MLPFLKSKQGQTAGLIIKHRSPDKKEGPDEAPEADGGLEAAAQDIMRAISDGDAKHLALALRSAFDILESEPHEEGPHTNDYDSLNEKATQDAQE